MVDVSKFNGKSWESSGAAVFHGFFSDYEEFTEGPGNYPAALVEWEDGKVESVAAHSIRFLVPTLTLEATKEAVRADWLSREMQQTGTPARSLPVLRDGVNPLPVAIGCRVVVCENSNPKLASWYGRTGIAGHPCRRYKDTLWQVRLSTGDELVVPESCLERVE